MSYAIIETGGKQLRVEPGRFYDIELLAVEPEEEVTIDKVLLINHEGEVHIGQPYVEGAAVGGTVLRHFRGRKVIVYKMRPKKKTRKKRGHRQEITRLMIDSIELNGSVLALREEINELEEDDSAVVAVVPEIEADEDQASVATAPAVTDSEEDGSELVGVAAEVDSGEAE